MKLKIFSSIHRIVCSNGAALIAFFILLKISRIMDITLAEKYYGFPLAFILIYMIFFDIGIVKEELKEN
jgi:hypothetical protein